MTRSTPAVLNYMYREPRRVANVSSFFLPAIKTIALPLRPPALWLSYAHSIETPTNQQLPLLLQFSSAQARWLWLLLSTVSLILHADFTHCLLPVTHSMDGTHGLRIGGGFSFFLSLPLPSCTTAHYNIILIHFGVMPQRESTRVTDRVTECMCVCERERASRPRSPLLQLKQIRATAV